MSSEFVDLYFAQTVEIIRGIDRDSIEAVANGIAAVRSRRGRLFILGSGGGAGHASHAASDFRVIAGIECYSPSDNISELTARVNDEGWDTSYSNWLRVSRLGEKDAILVLSVGGGDLEKSISKNLVRSVELAKEVGASIFGILGRNGGFTLNMADAAVLVPVVDNGLITPHTEGMQAVIWHLLVSHPALKVRQTKWETAAGSTSQTRAR